MEEKLWHKSYAPGVKKTLDYEKLTLSQALTRSARDFPNHTALNYMGKKDHLQGSQRIGQSLCKSLARHGR